MADDAARSAGEPFLANIVVSRDATTAGIIVELQSLESEVVRDLVHEILDLVPRYEGELGGDIYVAGDPVWTVIGGGCHLDRPVVRCFEDTGFTVDQLDSGYRGRPKAASFTYWGVSSPR